LQVFVGTSDDTLKDGTPVPFVSTADWVYLRLRQKEYDDDALRQWADRLAESSWDRALVFFKHEEDGIGPRLAARFGESLNP
jgi:uncharacterized protein YecE (DUF72 family)